MLINISNSWAGARVQHNNLLKNEIQAALISPSNDPVTVKTKKFLRWIEPHLISTKPQNLIHAINKFNKIRKQMTNAEFTTFKTQLKTVFKYDNFIKRKKIKWDAYKLCEAFPFKVCPYCHYTHIFTVIEEKGIRPTIDHYYLKDEYPFLALALNNLIPSCATCNSNLKGVINFCKTPHLNPLIDPESINFHCTKPGSTILDIVSNFENLKNELTIELRLAKCQKTKNSATTFNLNARYQNLVQYGINFIGSKTSIENSSGLSSFYSVGPQPPGKAVNFDAPPEEIQKRQLQFDREEYKNIIHGKMFADLYDQFDRKSIFF